MRLLFLSAIVAPALASASAPLAISSAAIDPALKTARAEAQAAERQRDTLERAAQRAGTRAEQIRAEQAAAAEAIAAAEARISVAEAEVRIASAQLATLREKLARQQRPLTALLSGLAVMGQRPPLLALADSDSIDEIVRVRILLDNSLPTIRARTASLRRELERRERFEQATVAARSGLAARRRQLNERQAQFAELEARALREQATLEDQAVAALEVASATGEELALLEGQAGSRQSASGLAGNLARLGPAPLPRSKSGPVVRPPFRYRLPSDAPVLAGTGTVNDNGIRSRGTALATRPGSTIRAPAEGIVRFSGPFRDYAGLVIIEHEDGWMSLIVNIASPLPRGSRVSLGQSIGRALSPIEVELSKDGRRVSPALIAGSSEPMSNAVKSS